MIVVCVVDTDVVVNCVVVTVMDADAIMNCIMITSMDASAVSQLHHFFSTGNCMSNEDCPWSLL